MIDAVPNVTDWHTLGQELDVPEPVLQAIRLDLGVRSFFRMKMEIFRRWLERDFEASWIKLEAALRRMGHHDEADGVRERYLGGVKIGGEAVQQPGEFCKLSSEFLHGQQIMVFTLQCDPKRNLD